MQFNEFNRRLEKCHLDEDTKYLLAHMFEVQVEFSKAIDTMTSLMGQLASKMHSMALINSGLLETVKQLQRRDAEVFSVRNTEN